MKAELAEEIVRFVREMRAESAALHERELEKLASLHDRVVEMTSALEDQTHEFVALLEARSRAAERLLLRTANKA